MNEFLEEEDLSKRIKILTKTEQKEIYDLPEFTNKDKIYYFQLEGLELEYFERIKNIESKIYFVLQLGFFRAKRRFFNFEFSEVKGDVEYILEKYFHKIKFSGLKRPCNKKTRLNQRSIILDIFKYQMSEKFEHEILEKAQRIVSIDSNPKYIFNEIIRFTDKRRIVLPAYTKIQQIITKTLITEENRIFSILNKELNIDFKMALDELLSKEEQNLYVLTIIKAPSKGFSYQNAANEIKKQGILKTLFTEAKKIIEKLKISNLTMKYISSLVYHNYTYHLKRFQENKRYFYLICFIYYRYLRANDDLVKTFLQLIGKYEKEVKALVYEAIVKLKLENSSNLKKFSGIIDFFIDEEFDSMLFKSVKEKAFSIIELKKMVELKNYILKSTFDEKAVEWDIYDEKYHTIKLNLRHIFKNIDYTVNLSEQNDHDFKSHLFDAITFLKEFINDKKTSIEDAPIAFIPKKTKKFICPKLDINPKRYEIIAYQALKDNIISGNIFINDSTEFKCLEDDLIDNKYFRQKSSEILASLDLPYIAENFSTVLDYKLNILQNIINKVNKNILKGKNPHFKNKIKKEVQSFNLSYQGQLTNQKETIFSQLPQVQLVDVIRFTQEKVEFVSEFSHLLNKSVKTGVNETYLLASIVAYGTNLGIGKMSSSAKIPFYDLHQASNNYLRIETLNNATEKIINATKELPIYKYYNLYDDIENVHSSSDGQKFGVSVDVFNARYSPKYFGLEKGVSVVTLNANYLPLSAKVISGNEYEGNHVLELLLMNESNIQPQIHSTDTHGTNDINFALLDLCGYYFAPRYKNIENEFRTIYSPNEPKEYNDKFILKPNKRINRELILQEEHNIKRIIASIMLKTTTVSTIVKKLSGYKSNSTRKALSELDKIIKMTYLFHYIDDLELRQSVQKALNRGELYHRLKRAVFYAHNGKLRAKSEYEQIIYQECNRLICSAIIFYNSYLLSEMFMKYENVSQSEQSKILSQFTPISWQHINFYGSYLFNKEDSNKNLEKLDNIIKDGSLIEKFLKNLTQESLSITVS